jgi:predicted ester cyclase
MSAEENKALIRHVWEDRLNAQDLSVFGEYLARNFVYHPPTSGHEPSQAQWFAAFPDSHYTVEDLLAVDDKVILRWSWSGTHQGELYGIAPTGNRLTTKGMEINRFVDGKVVEVWGEADTLGFLQQLGVLPELGPA